MITSTYNEQANNSETEQLAPQYTSPCPWTLHPPWVPEDFLRAVVAWLTERRSTSNGAADQACWNQMWKYWPSSFLCSHVDQDEQRKKQSKLNKKQTNK